MKGIIYEHEYPIITLIVKNLLINVDTFLIEN